MISSGIPYFCGMQFADNAEITSMEGNCNPVIKIYPRNIGGIVKSTGVVSKTITINCRAIAPSNITRSELEDKMNAINEKFTPLNGDLYIDGNTYNDCVIKSISYSNKFVNNFLQYDIVFSLGEQFTNVIQPQELYDFSRGRKGIVSIDGQNDFELWHNIDIVRNFESSLVTKILGNYYKDLQMGVNGGIEHITAYGWLRTDSNYGWKQSVTAYIYNIMQNIVGEIGTLRLGTSTIKYCLFTSVKLIELKSNSARYTLDLLTSLQC